MVSAHHYSIAAAIVIASVCTGVAQQQALATIDSGESIDLSCANDLLLIENCVQIETDRLEYQIQLDLISTHTEPYDEYFRSSMRLCDFLRAEISKVCRLGAAGDRIDHVLGFLDHKIGRINNLATLVRRSRSSRVGDQSSRVEDVLLVHVSHKEQTKRQ
jgi:hypothetical protein